MMLATGLLTALELANTLASKKNAPPAEKITAVVDKVFDLETTKSLVRPKAMGRLANMTLLQIFAVSGIGVAYAFGYIADAERAMTAAMIIGGGAGLSGSGYLWGHTARSVEKVKAGAA